MLLNTFLWLSLFMFAASWGMAPQFSIEANGAAGRTNCNVAVMCAVGISFCGFWIGNSWRKPTWDTDPRCRVPLYKLFLFIWTMGTLAGAAYAASIVYGKPPKDGDPRGGMGAPIATGVQGALMIVFWHLGVGQKMAEGTIPVPARKREPQEDPIV